MYIGTPQEAVLIENGSVSQSELGSCRHEEADDRIIYHVNHAVEKRKTKIVVATEDTDVVINLLFHYSASWRDQGLQELWLNKGSGVKRSAYPLHILSSKIGDNVRYLPAVHALSGADTTSKACSKLKILSQQNEYNHFLKGFGELPLTKEMITSAESFLVRCISSVKPSKKASTQSIDKISKTAPPSSA